MNQTRLTVAVLVALLAQGEANAAVHLFNLNGNAGAGLLPGNENHAINGTPGSGSEVGAGISYDDVTNMLNINIAWGSANGFTNLTGDAAAGHVHGPTAIPAPAGFSQDAGVVLFLSTLANWNASASSGGCSNCTVTLNAAQEIDLLAERYYINVHTSANGGGEIRGHLVLTVIPEPSTLLLLTSVGGVAMMLRRKRQ